MNYKKTAETLIKGAHTLDHKYYVEQGILEEEYKNIFLKTWICAGRLSELENIGDYKMIEIGNESVIIIRNKLKELSAYYNVCRHRGTRICSNSTGNYSKSIQCGYHGWTYNLDGSLIGAPNMDNVEGFNKSDYSLHQIQIAEWEGFIFINLSEDPKDFEDEFSPLIGRFSNWNISDLNTYKTKQYNVKSNWKLVVQNYCECYHCPILHPELAAIHNYMGGQNDLYKGPFLGGYMDFNQDKDSVTSSGKLCCPPLDGIKKEDLNRVYYYSIFPNLLLSLHPDYVMYHIILPNGIDKCDVTCSWLFDNNAIESKKYNLDDAVEFWDMTNKQDWYITELSQLGIQSKKYAPAPYSGQESLLAAFDQYYLDIINK